MEDTSTYKGYEICVRTSWVVLGEDPMADPVEGYVADIRLRDAEESADAHVLYDFPFDPAESTFHAATQDEAIAQAQAFIDVNGTRGSGG